MADRTYLPWLDAIDIMREENIALYALESKHNVADFDLIGITLQSELNYTNVLELLDLSGIPIHSSDRTDVHPIVIAGGPCASNPMALRPFIDAFLIGEGEDAIEEIVGIIRDSKKKNSCAESHPEPVEGRRYSEMSSVVRQAHHDMNGTQDSCLRRNDIHGDCRNDNVTETRYDILKQLAQIKGMYVPSVHDKMISGDSNFRIKIRKYNGFATHDKIHKPQLMPWQLATHNRYVAEIMRGCTRGCRFCHAGYFYRPVRERSPEDILEALLKEVEAFGWDEAGLISLSSSDYTCIRPLLEAMLKKVNQDKTHVSLPSLRVDSFDTTLISLLKEVGREGLTIAPEAGSQRLRNIVNKNLSEEDILHGVRIAKELGWQKIKLYFMVGLPMETEDDIQGIIDLIYLIIGETGKRFQINVSLSPFVPKTHTPFQWVGMLKPEEILKRVLIVKNAFQRHKFIKVKYHTIESSLLETIISKGNEQTAVLLEQAWKNGARYDGWNEGFKWNNWLSAAEITGYNIDSVYESIPLDSRLPWDFIDLGVEQTWLQSEWKKAEAESVSEDCRNGCIGCGICNEELGMEMAESSAEFLKTIAALEMPVAKIDPGIKSNFIKSWNYRLTYEKGEDFRFIGHLDWMRMVFRMMSRCNLAIVYTQGFNPHPKVSFSPALAIGVTGEQEYFDFHTSVEYSIDELLSAFNPLFIEGLVLKSIRMLKDREKDIQPIGDDLVIELPDNSLKDVSDKIVTFNKRECFPLVIYKKDGERNYDLKQVLSHIELQKDKLVISKLLTSPNIYDVLEAITGISKDEIHNWNIYRKRLWSIDSVT